MGKTKYFLVILGVMLGGVGVYLFGDNVGLRSFSKFGQNNCVRLTGDPDSLAARSLEDLQTSDAWADEHEIELGAHGGRVPRTLVEVVFVGGLTVQEVNDFLTSHNACIVSSLEGVLMPTVRIPDPGSLSALDRIIERMESDPSVRRVNKAYFVDEPVLVERPER